MEAQVPLEEQVIKHTLEFEVLKDLVRTPRLDKLTADEDEKLLIRESFTEIVKPHLQALLRIRREEPEDAEEQLGALFRKQVQQCSDFLDELLTPPQKKRGIQLALERRICPPVANLVNDHPSVYFLGLSATQCEELLKLGERIDSEYSLRYAEAVFQRCVRIASALPAEQRLKLERAVGRKLNAKKNVRVEQAPSTQQVFEVLNRHGPKMRMAVQLLAPSVSEDLGINDAARAKIGFQFNEIMAERQSESVKRMRALRDGAVSESEHLQATKDSSEVLEGEFERFLSNVLTEGQRTRLKQLETYNMYAGDPSYTMNHESMVEYLGLTVDQQNEVRAAIAEAATEFEKTKAEIRREWLEDFAMGLNIDQRAKLEEALAMEL